MAGSFVNQLMAEGQAVKVPTVGMGVTILLYTDRHAGTIVEVKNPKTVVVQEDASIRVDKNGMSECQEYRYEPYPNGEKVVYTLRRNGRWVRQGEPAKGGTSIHIGERRAYHDFSF